MKLGVLTINNFARVKKIELDLSQSIFSQVIGLNEDTGASNESGKTTIFNAPCWCLYGKYPSGNGRIGDEVVNPLVGKDCLVSQQILLEDKIVTVTRTRRHSKLKNVVLINIIYNNGEVEDHQLDLGPKNIDAANRMIEDIIGMDYQTFIRSHYFPQEGVEPFGRMTDKELKNFFLEKLLNLSWLPDAFTSTKETLGYLEVHLIEKTASLNKLKDDIIEREERILEYEKKNEEWKEEKEREISKIRLEIVDLNDQLQVIENKREAIGDKIKEIETALAITNDVTNWKKVLSNAESKFLDISRRVAITEPKVNSLKRNIKDSEAKYEEVTKLIGTTCGFCGTIIDSSHLPHVTKGLLADIRRDKKEFDAVNKLYLEDVSEKEAIEKEIRGLNNKVKEYNEKQDQHLVLKEQLLELRQMTDINSIKDKIIIKEELIRTKEKGSPPFESFVNKERVLINKNRDDIVVLEKEIEDLEKDIRLNQFWNKAFSPTGIQSFILDSVTKVINSFIADYMRVLSEGRISVRFNTVRLLKSGEFRERFGLEINNMDGGNYYGSLSGGAKRRVDIACSMAISKFIRQTSGKELKFIVLDEIIVGMDEYWSEEFIKLLVDEYRGYSCFFVTHQQVNPVYFDRTITVRKKDGVTSIQ